MLPPLKIKVLFCYSKQVLQDTYNNVHELKVDNSNLCTITSGIFHCNFPIYSVPTNMQPYERPFYSITFRNVATVKINKLQEDIDTLEEMECLDGIAIDNLLKSYVNGKFPKIDMLKAKYQANVVAFQVKLCGEARLKGASYSIGFQQPNEACLAIARGQNMQKEATAVTAPTTLAHEVGHILGCRHSLEEGEIFNPDFAGTYGHAVLENPNAPFHKETNKAKHGTIMSYAPKPVYYFSNPNKFPYPAPNQNTACGVAGISECYQTIEFNLPRLANSV